MARVKRSTEIKGIHENGRLMDGAAKPPENNRKFIE